MEYIIIIVAAVLGIGLLIFSFKRKGGSGCDGCSGNCNSCSSYSKRTEDKKVVIKNSNVVI
ncbi:MAG: FeoB-associated Cys-rich membrane protein [Fusobacteria bacterium]|nr:FeoB-associated Cys-rich membrane protein [Fusobacteriota bacterium]